MNDYWKHRPPPAIDDIEALARYNAERSRGIAHDPEWDARMAQLQEHFAARQVAALTEKEISRRRRRGRWT